MSKIVKITNGTGNTVLIHALDEEFELANTANITVEVDDVQYATLSGITGLTLLDVSEANGESVEIAGNSAHMVSATVTRAATTDAYTANDVVSTAAGANISFTNVLATPGGVFKVIGAKLRIDVNAVPANMAGFKIHLFNAAPTAIADNAAFNLIEADRAKYLGNVAVTVPIDLGDTIFVSVDSLGLLGKLAASSTTLYAQLTTDGNYTPAASEVFTITLVVVPM